jgi:cell division protein FtsZ
VTVPAANFDRPLISVVGVGGAGGNAVNNMIARGLTGVQFLVCNTDAQALSQSMTEQRVQLGRTLTRGLGAGARPDIGANAAQESLDDILDKLKG